MKKIFSLLILTTVTLFFGCADEDSTTPPAADTSYNALLRDKSVNDFTEEEAVYMTAQNLYNISEISEDAKKNLMTFYEMMKNGSIIPNGQGLGDIKYPSIASTAFQSLFQNLLAAPAQMGDIKTKSILTYSSVNVSEEEFSALLLEITNSQADISFLSGFMYVCLKSFSTFILLPLQIYYILTKKRLECWRIIFDKILCERTRCVRGCSRCRCILNIHFLFFVSLGSCIYWDKYT